MAALVDQGMREGASGLSSGLEYDVGSYASTDELVELSKAAGAIRRLLHDALARRGRQELRRLRRGDRDLADAADCRSTSRTSSSRTIGVWGKATDAVALVDTARAKGQDVTADCYPYRGLALEHRGPRARTSSTTIRRASQEALARASAAPRTDHRSPPARRIRPTPGTTSRRSRRPRDVTPVALYSQDRPGRRRGRHRPLDDRGGRRGLLPPALGDGGLATAAIDAITRAAPARSRACSAASCASSICSRSKRRSAR